MHKFKRATLSNRPILIIIYSIFGGHAIALYGALRVISRFYCAFGQFACCVFGTDLVWVDQLHDITEQRGAYRIHWRDSRSHNRNRTATIDVYLHLIEHTMLTQFEWILLKLLIEPIRQPTNIVQYCKGTEHPIWDTKSRIMVLPLIHQMRNK